MTRPKDKGTAAETMVANYLKRTYWPHAERRALSGGKDKGDITGTPGLAWEVKAAKTISVPAWLRETEAERVNAGADYATLVIKPQGVGKERVASFYAVMDRSKFADLWTVVWRDARDSRHLLSGAWVAYTTPRRHSLAQLIELRMANPLTNLWWAHYETHTGDYTVTNLSQMAAMLSMAGYGTPMESE